MNASAAFYRAIRGPLVLITLGVLFALDYFSHMPFYRTWPVLLIVLGLLKLLERMASGSDPGAASRGGL